MFCVGKRDQYRSRFHHPVHNSGASTIKICTSELFSKESLFQNSSISSSVSNRLCCRILTWPPLQVAYEMNNKDNETRIYPCNKWVFLVIVTNAFDMFQTWWHKKVGDSKIRGGHIWGDFWCLFWNKFQQSHNLLSIESELHWKTC